MSAPSSKVTMSTATAAAVGIMAWLARSVGVELGDELVSLIVALAVAIAGYRTPERRPSPSAVRSVIELARQRASGR